MLIAVSIILSIELIIISILDYKYRKISNLWSILNLIIFIILIIVTKENQLKNIYLPLIVLAITFILFVLNIMGGGDGKYLTTFLLLIPNHYQYRYLIYLMVAIITYTLPFFIYSIKKKQHFKKGPFAPIMLIAWMLYLGIEMANLW